MTKPKIEPFVQLGALLGLFSKQSEWPGFTCGLTEEEYLSYHQRLITMHHHNGWFTWSSCHQALSEWSQLLQASSLLEWLETYPAPISQKKIGLICAGNIPAVGFHDIVCILLSGHKALIKLSKDDRILIPIFMECLVKFEPQLKQQFALVEKLSDFDAVIATGSNNSARYFESYFGHVPHIIRKSRTSVAVLDGSETNDQLSDLAKDVFTYFGLGCRNVSKVFLPRDMHLDRLFNAFFAFQEIGMHAKYANNYDYNKAVWLLNREELLDNGFILLKHDENLACPTASLFYEYYDDLEALESRLKSLHEQIQCRLGVNGLPLGSAQSPKLSDYADGVDTMTFLSLLN
jgi:hypothetical protein